MLGNFVTGCSIVAPAGMLGELAEGLDVSIRTAGLLITFGAVVLCIGSPLTAWLTSRIERRTLLAMTLFVLAITNAASSFAPDFASLLAIRLVMVAVGVIYTPQAAGTAALIVPAEKRGSTMAYVFLGWSIAAAAGLPTITFIASRYGWHAAYGGIAAVAVLGFLLLLWRLPGGLVVAPVDLRTWLDLARNRAIVVLLAITTLQMSGQFAIFSFMAPLLKKLAGAGPDAISLAFMLFGALSAVGVVIATRIVDRWGSYLASVFFTSLMLAGVTLWAVGAGSYLLMAAAVAIWGLGFAAANSMQQVRLVAAAPEMASASVSLNTSVLYVGQAIGSAIGGALYARDLPHETGFVAAGFIALAWLAILVLTRPRMAPQAG
jgi:predicted MFS family arabinose efflux permease